MRLEGLGKFKIFFNLIGSRPRELPALTAMLTRAPLFLWIQ
jgi:hypothetical protein